MAGPQVWLAAKGAQDVRLTYQPQTTAWKATYLRHTNWASETIEGQMTGSVRMGGVLSHTIQRNADLASRSYIKLVLPKLVDNRAATNSGIAVNRDGTAATASNLGVTDDVRYINGVGLYAFDENRCKIGGHEFDKYSGKAARYLEDLLTPARNRFADLIGDYATDADASVAQCFTPLARAALGAVTNAVPTETVTYFVPMFYWWSMLARDKSLPLIGLQYHQVNLEMRLKQWTDIITFTYPDFTGRSTDQYTGGDAANIGNSVAAINTNGTSGSVLFNPDNLAVSLYIDFVFLDTRERKAFSCKCLEYLIEQTQETELNQSSSGYTSFSQQINFNHPVMFLIYSSYFVARAKELNHPDDLTGNRGGLAGKSNAKFSAVDMFETMTIKVNNQDLFQPKEAAWLRLVQGADAGGFRPDLFFYVVPFCTDMHEHSVVGQRAKSPTGSINMSRIDTVAVSESAIAGKTNVNAAVIDPADPNPAAPTVFLDVAQTAQDTSVGHYVMGRNTNYAKIAAGQAGLFYAN